jgi:hypothetical protein
MPSFSNKFRTGELAGSATAVQNPDVRCRLVKFMAALDNVGKVYIGGEGVTVADGSTDTTTGWPLDAGIETPWIAIQNVNLTYRICDNAGDDCFYMVVG